MTSNALHSHNTESAILTRFLPRIHVDISFRTNSSLVKRAVEIMKAVYYSDLNGNQYILVHNLPDDMVAALSGGDALVLSGRFFRFMFRGNTGVIRVTSDWSNAGFARSVASVISRKFLSIGITPSEGRLPTDEDLQWNPERAFGWSAMTCFKTKVKTPTGIVKEEKSADYSFLPAERYWRSEEQGTKLWPTCVIESGVAVSLPRLREDVKWWFQGSKGEVRVVLVVTVYPLENITRVEKWQLRHPSCVNMESMLPSESKAHPPICHIPPDLQRPYIAQSATITSDGIDGSFPMVLPYQAMFDEPLKKDIVLTKKDFKGLVFDAPPGWPLRGF